MGSPVASMESRKEEKRQLPSLSEAVAFGRSPSGETAAARSAEGEGTETEEVRANVRAAASATQQVMSVAARGMATALPASAPAAAVDTAAAAAVAAWRERRGELLPSGGLANKRFSNMHHCSIMDCQFPYGSFWLMLLADNR